MQKLEMTRRLFLGSISIFAVNFLNWRQAFAQGLSPSAPEGPFYPTPSMRMKDADNDLVKILGLVREAGGEVITLRGKITDRRGNPRAGHRIEIWQCDLNGKYLHTGDDRDVIYDQGFQGFGHDITDADGNYSFRTIKPGRYPGRTPHIHVKVFEGARELLTTQFYLAGEPENAEDDLFQQLSIEEADSVSMVFARTQAESETTVNLSI